MAFFAEIGFNVGARDGFHSAAFQVVSAAVEHSARACKVVKISSHGVLNEFARRASGVSRQLVKLRLQFGREMYFHTL
jgi:hypothetical protein